MKYKKYSYFIYKQTIAKQIWKLVYSQGDWLAMGKRECSSMIDMYVK